MSEELATAPAPAPAGEDGASKDPQKRERWTSNVAFYFAAIGAAVGFGNVWRFPALAADYGGGAFFIPYLMALFLIGIPLLILEISLGQYYQTGDVGVFGSFHMRWRGVGVSSVACAYMVVTYYSVLIAWVIHAFFDTWSEDAPWVDEGVTGSEAVTYFVNEIIGASTLGDDGRPTRVVGANVGYSALAWFLIWACLAGGTKWTGRITYVTMGIPIVLLFVFLGRAVSLEGSSDGIHEYIGIWDMSVLKDRPECWSTAVSQIFFSIGVTFGIMTAFGSYNEKDEPAVFHSCVIAGANSMFSFISGFAVFAAMGHLAYLEGVTVPELDFAGFSLVFGTWPVVMGTLPGGIHWVRLLFFDLFLLGIDSGFGLLEGALTAAADTVYLSKFTKSQLAAVMCVIGFLFSIIYCTDAGLNFLDVVDFYINFVMLLVGFFEAFAAGWIFGLDEQIKACGIHAVASYFSANFISVLVACAVWFGTGNKDNAVWGGFVALFLTYFFFLGLTVFFLKKKMAEEPDKWSSLGDIFWELSFRNIMELREKLSSTIGFLPTIWAYMIKQMIPHVVLILFINLAQSTTENGDPLFGNYGGYIPWPFQIIGYGTVIFAFGLFSIGFAAPDLYSGLTLLDEKAIIHGYGQGTPGKEVEDKKLMDAASDEEVHSVEKEETAGKEEPVEQADSVEDEC